MTFNDRSTLLSHLATRRSGKPRDMIAPGPSHDELVQMIALAGRTPDHGKLNPWRFVIVRDQDRAALKAVLERAFLVSNPDAREGQVDAATAGIMDGPALIVAISSPHPAHKIPLWEQELSCGAACMNLLHAIHAHGYVGGWITGWAAFDETVRRAFCHGVERIAGFIHIGTQGGEPSERPRPELADICSDWVAPA